MTREGPEDQLVRAWPHFFSSCPQTLWSLAYELAQGCAGHATTNRLPGPPSLSLPTAAACLSTQGLLPRLPPSKGLLQLVVAPVTVPAPPEVRGPPCPGPELDPFKNALQQLWLWYGHHSILQGDQSPGSLSAVHLGRPLGLNHWGVEPQHPWESEQWHGRWPSLGPGLTSSASRQQRQSCRSSGLGSLAHGEGGGKQELCSQLHH